MIGNLIPGLISLGVAPSTTSYESIATVTVGSGGSSSIDFTSIPNTYSHLQIRILARTSLSQYGSSQAKMTVNGVTSGYTYHILIGDGSSASAEGSANTAFFSPAPKVTDNLAASNIFGVGIIDILDYANTNKYKTGRCLSGYDANGSGAIILSSSIMGSTTSAISSVKFEDQSGGNFMQYSSFALYGIKA